MLDVDGTLAQQAAESLRVSEELYRRANETAKRLSMRPGHQSLLCHCTLYARCFI